MSKRITNHSTNAGAPPPAPWERQPDETSRQYHAFKLFRDMGPNRTLVELAKLLKFTQQRAHQLCTKNHWQQRIRAWEQHIEAFEQQELIRLKKEAVARHLNTSHMLQDIAEKKLKDKRFHKKVSTARDVLSYAKAGVQMEADTLGINPRRDEQPAPVQNNLLIEIQLETEAFRQRLIAECKEQLSRGVVIDQVTVDEAARRLTHDGPPACLPPVSEPTEATEPPGD
jgi:hypothetical protein